jgi:hypothetical protein
MRTRSCSRCLVLCSRCLVLIAAFSIGSSEAYAATTARPSSELVLSFHGTRALNGDGSGETGWGGGGSVRHAVGSTLKVWACVERVRVAHEGSSFVRTVTPWTFGAEIGPRDPRRIEPFFRLGLGMYGLMRRGEYVSPFNGRPTQYSDSGVFSGLNFAGGGYARLPGRAILELSGTFLQSFSREAATDSPSLGEVQMMNFRLGLGYPLK